MNIQPATFKLNKSLASASGILSLLMSTSMFSQPVQAAPRTAQLEEIVVTAQKREQNLQNVGTTVTAFSANMMADLGVISSTDIVMHTPNLSMGSPLGEGNNPVFSIRGVGLNDFGENNESPVAVYVDEVYSSTLAGLSFQTFDLQRVEVLKGPQGTLYGRNSTGGLIHYISVKPSDVTSGYISASYGEHNKIRIEDAIGGKLADNVSARLSTVYLNQDPYVKNRVGDDTHEENSYAGRFQLSVTPSDNLDILLNIHGGKANTNAPSYQHSAVQYNADGKVINLPDDVTNPICMVSLGVDGGPGNDCFGYRDRDGDPYANAVDRPGFLKTRTYGGSAKINLTLGDTILTSITAYEKLKKDFGEDTDVGPVNAFAVSNYVDSKQFSQELRLSGTSDQFRWVVGGFYFYRKINGSSELDMRGIDFTYPKGIYQDKTTSVSAFGQVEYDATDKLTLIAGARYTHDKKSYSYYAIDFTGMTGTLPPGVDPADYHFFEFNKDTAGNLAEAKANLYSYRLEADYTPVDNVMLYASASQGTKGPGFISGTLAFFGPEPFDNIGYKREKLQAYEAGIKSRFANNHVQVNAAVFYYNYLDYQAQSFINTLARVLNKDATVKGAEIEVVTRPLDGLELRLSGALLDTNFKDTGNDLVLAPPYQIDGSVRYATPLGKGTIAAIVDFSYTGKQYFTLQNDPSSEEDPYGIVNARITYSFNEHLDLSVWAKNLTDTVYRGYSIQVADFGFQQNMYGRPRWFGGTVRYSF